MRLLNKGRIQIAKKVEMQRNIQIKPYGTYMKDNVWVTPIGNYNILHYDCPTDEEIKQRAQEAIKEIVNEEGFEDNCPLCQLMKRDSHDIVYYCQTWCHECSKRSACVNFDPNSREEQKS